MTWHLQQLGYQVNRKRVQRLMRVLGLEAIAPKPPKTSVAHPEHRIYPYLLRGLEIVRPNPCVVGRHHICPDATRVHVPLCDN